MPDSPLPTFQPRRRLGRTGFVATQLGIGDVADRSVPIGKCVATLRRAIDAGLNVIDTAPGYEEGYSEQIVGQTLRDLGPARETMFLIDKVDFLDQPVGPQVEASLTRLRLDHVDLMVFHGLSNPDIWERVSSIDGGMEQLGRCIKGGKARFRGISSHHPVVLRRAIESGLCDVVMFAIGAFVDVRYVEEILPLAKDRGVGTVCFKTFGAGKLLSDTAGYGRPIQVRPRGKISSGGVNATHQPADSSRPQLPRLTVEECVHYTLTADPDVALLGMSFPNEQDAAFAAARSFKKLSPSAMADLRRRAAIAIEGKGSCWWNPPAPEPQPAAVTVEV